MKQRTKKRGLPWRKYDVRKDLKPSQLREIGAVCIAWNDLEEIVNSTFCCAACIPGVLWLEVSTRINGFDGKVQIIKTAMRDNLQLDNAMLDPITQTYAKIAELKTYRDTVIHSRPFDTRTGVGETIRRRGQIDHILLSAKALRVLYDWIDAVRQEALAILAMTHAAAVLKRYSDSYADADVSDREKQLPELPVQEYAALLQERLKKRKALPPLPPLPPERPYPSKLVMFPPTAKPKR